MLDLAILVHKFVDPKPLSLDECNRLAQVVLDREHDLKKQLEFTLYLLRENTFLKDMVRVRIEDLTDSQLLDLF